MGRKERGAIAFQSRLSRSRLYQKFAVPHYLLAVKPDIKIATDAIDVRPGSPICAGVLGVGMTKRDVDSRNLFVL
jgi:hypothetical protein